MGQETTYRGDRTIDGLLVTVDGDVLNDQQSVAVFSDCGFEWSYEGDGPKQLALAILVRHLGDDATAQDLADPFMRRVVANFGNDWEMKGADIDAALENIKGA
ncbi:MAG: DUF6166 domain-containing protein [Pseudomonadota bacterium]